jgi:hypothetical protein
MSHDFSALVSVVQGRNDNRRRQCLTVSHQTTEALIYAIADAGEDHAVQENLAVQPVFDPRAGIRPGNALAAA